MQELFFFTLTKHYKKKFQQSLVTTEHNLANNSEEDKLQVMLCAMCNIILSFKTRICCK